MATNTKINQALEAHLKKWYKNSVSLRGVGAEEETDDNGGYPVAPISLEAIKIDISKNFRLSAISGLQEQIKQLKEDMGDRDV